MSGSKKAALCVLVSLGLIFSLASSPALAGEAGPEMLERDITRLTGLGAVYDPQGFTEMEAQETPYDRFRRVDPARLVGRVVYSTQGRVRIWKRLYCGNLDVIILELSVRDKSGEHIPFGWQDCSLICDHGGACDGQSPLYLDLSGDGRPDTRFARVDAISTSSIGADWIDRRTFSLDIIPSWVAAKVAPDFRNTYPLGPDEKAPINEDHPTSLSSRSTLQNEP